MRLLVACALLLAACSHAPIMPVVSTELLLDAAAADFHAHALSPAVHFRNVRAGRLAGDQEIICGEFLPILQHGEIGWSPFATIKTSGYEQYNGAMAANYCKLASLEDEDLSTALQSRLPTP